MSPVDRLVHDFAAAGASYISFHPEATEHVDRTIGLIRELGCKPGIALNPATSLQCLDYTLEKIDLVLVMSVNPGFGGQAFLTSSLDKLSKIRARINALAGVSDRTIRLEVDGGVKPENIGRIAAAGADMFVAGSAIFNADDYASTITALRNQIAAADS